MATSRSVLSLFTGAGGLDLGLEAAGFQTVLCVENDPVARATLAGNRPGWTLAEPGDIFALEPEHMLRQAGLRPGELTLLAGGPPCQPWSRAASWANGSPNGLADSRSSTLHAWLRALAHARPEVILLENVQGLSSLNGGEGLKLLLRGVAEVNALAGTAYNPAVFSIDAAGFGVPQHRRRVFMLAHRGGRPFTAPAPTHGDGGVAGVQEPYLTAWDAIGDLDRRPADDGLRPSGKWADLLPTIPEGGNYLWHTARGGGVPLFGWRTRFWSFLLKLAKDRPAWTISASPGPATGPFHWGNRLLSSDELARLQTLPSAYRVVGNRRQVQRQIGNAVPSALAELLGLEIRRQLLQEDFMPQLRTLLPARRFDRPGAEAPAAVPRRFLALKGVHPAHPGPGAGPGARRPEAAS